MIVEEMQTFRGYAIIKDGMPYICSINNLGMVDNRDEDIEYYEVHVMFDLSHLNKSDEGEKLYYSCANDVYNLVVKSEKDDLHIILDVIDELNKQGKLMTREQYEREISND